MLSSVIVCDISLLLARCHEGPAVHCVSYDRDEKNVYRIGDSENVGRWPAAGKNDGVATVLARPATATSTPQLPFTVRCSLLL